MRIETPCDWVIERLESRRPFFAVRINDGEHIQMYKVHPEGKLLGTDANPSYTHWACGDAYHRMLEDIAAMPEDRRREQALIGCSWNTDRSDEMGWVHFRAEVERLGLVDANWCNEHWALDGTVDGSTVRMLDALRRVKPVLVTCEALSRARYCMDADWVETPREDSWLAREEVFLRCLLYAEQGRVFVWCAGGGLKPTAWRLFKEYPTTSHVDLGHLFNGALGFKDYGWLIRGDGPWHYRYFAEFAPYVHRAILNHTLIGSGELC